MKSGHLQRRKVSGLFPQSGAIFMANSFTRQECFDRKLFGLPSNFAEFVLKIKTGMFLFLFDPEKRNLYGVFEATSDGAMNIFPKAYKSSGKQFPAQVRFSTIWRCAPVPEHAFRDAIEENYYAPFKFHFGLSKDQVERLLYLFDKRQLKNPNVSSLVWQSQCESSSQITNSVVESGTQSIDDSESVPESVPEKSASFEVSNHGNANELDYIPLPSIDLEEIEISWPPEFAQWNQPEYLWTPDFSSGSQSCTGQEDDNNGGNLHVRGLYSDGPKERKSVFSRLSSNGQRVPGTEQRGRISGSEIRCMKRKSDLSMTPVLEVEGVIAKNEEKSYNISRKHKKKRRRQSKSIW